MNKTVFLFLIAALYLTACQSGQNSQEATSTEPVKEEVKDGVFVHISHGPEDAHRVAMGLKMATLMAEDKDVLVYFDINGIDVVTKEAEDITMPTFPSSKEALQELLEKNVPVYACPGCMQAKGVTEEDLMPGIKVAEKEAFFNFTEGRILTIDY